MIDMYYFKKVHYGAKQVIHPIPEYKTSKHGIIYTNIISKYKN